MDSGLSALQSADYVVAWICMEDDGVGCRFRALADRTGEIASRAITWAKGRDAPRRVSDADW